MINSKFVTISFVCNKGKVLAQQVHHNVLSSRVLIGALSHTAQESDAISKVLIYSLL